MKTIWFFLISAASVAAGYFLQGNNPPSPSRQPIAVSTMMTTDESDDPPANLRLRGQVNQASKAVEPPANHANLTAVPVDPKPSAKEIAGEVLKELSPFIERVKNLDDRTDKLEKLMARYIEATTLSESQARRTEAELRAELADLKSSMGKLKDEIAKEREPDPVTKKLAKTLETLAATVAKLNRRIEEMMAPPTPHKPKLEVKPEPKPDSKSVSEKKSLSWVTVPATVMPPCRRGLVTVEINPEGGTQAFTCPHCRGATFHATVLSTSPLRVQTSRP